MQTKKLGFGCMRLPQLDKDDASNIDMAVLADMVDVFIDNGFTYFDTAYMYHAYKSETAIREALIKRHKRDSFTLATKLPIMFVKQKEDQQRFFDEQLIKCGIDYFDYYLIHHLCTHHYEKAEKFDSFEFIKQKKQEGKIKHIGFSYHDNSELLDEILSSHPETDFVQLQVNYIDWENESIQSAKCCEVAKKHNKPIIVMEPVKGGSLACVPQKAERIFKESRPDMSVASWAIRYAASIEGVTVVLSGMSDMVQLLDNISYMKDFEPFTKEDHETVDKAVDIIKESIAIPCTSCGYCVEKCPKNIAIPKYFALYNAEQHALNKLFSTQSFYYNNYTKKYGKASDCIECGQCEKSCPQHIDIINKLKDVAKVFGR